MKISFKLLDGNRLASDNNKVLMQYIIDEANLKNTLSIIDFNEESICEMVEKNHVYVVLPMNGKDSDYRVCDAFVVRRNDGSICVWLWTNQFVNFKDGDAIFTTKDEAERLVFELNSVTKNKKVQSEIDKSVDTIESQLNNAHNLREKIAAYSKDIDEKEKLLFDAVIDIIDNDIKKLSKSLEQLEMLKYLAVNCLPELDKMKMFFN